MLSFKIPELSDRRVFAPLLLSSGKRGCEYSFGNIYMWSPVYSTLIAEYGGFFLSRDAEGRYCFPAGRGDLRAALEAVIEDAAGRGRRLRFFGLERADVDALVGLFPGRFDIAFDRDFSDYIYRTEDLALLGGRKYHPKRNHIAAFIRDNNWSSEPLTRENIPECIEMNDAWEKENIAKNPENIGNELFAVGRAFSAYEELELEGILIRIDGRVTAYTFGERLTGDTFCTHAEKAFAGVRGSYQIVNREFAAALSGRFEFINREEDTGSENLRMAKLSYQPSTLLEKYTAIIKT